MGPLSPPVGLPTTKTKRSQPIIHTYPFGQRPLYWKTPPCWNTIFTPKFSSSGDLFKSCCFIFVQGHWPEIQCVTKNRDKCIPWDRSTSLGRPHIFLIFLLFLINFWPVYLIEIERVKFCAWAIFSEGPRIFSTRDEVSNLPPLLSRSTSSRLQLDPDKNDDSCLKKKKTHQEDLLNISGIGAFWLELVLSSWIIGG